MKPSKAKYIVEKLFEVKSDEDFFKYLSMKFSDNKKIYKYCPVYENLGVEDNYSIKNLLNKSVYLSMPSEFNDPFDASIGLSDQVIYDQIMIGMLNTEYLDKSNVDNLKISKDSVSTYPKFKKTVSDMDISLIKDMFSYYAESEERYNELIYLRSNNDGREIMLRFLSNEEYAKRFFANLINPELCSEDTINRITELLNVENIKKLLEPSLQIPMISSNQKENLFNKDVLYAQVESFGLDKQIVDDAIGKMQESFINMAKKIAEFIGHNIGITCFSETYDNPLMWSHYTNKHKGFCVEYDIDMLIKNNPKTAGQLLPVIYLDNRPIFDKNMISAINIKSGKPVIAEDANKYFTKVLVTKAKMWKYEKEWRLISKVDESRIFNLNCITGIYLGAKTSTPLLQFMKKFCLKEEINLYQYSMDIKTYKMNLNTVLTF